jgi:hypothetical protein
MGETAQYKQLKEIIYDYMDEAQQNSAALRRLWNIAVRGVVDLALDVIPNIKSCRLCVDGNKTAQLPTDYLNWSKVGVLNSSGEVATLKYNSTLTLYGANDTNRLSKNTDSVGFDLNRISDLFYLNYFDNGYGYGLVNLFGISGNEATKIGDFRIDKDCGIIILDNCFPADYLILEYLAAPSFEDGYKVPVQAVEAVIAWISWKDTIQLAASRKVSIYDKTARRREYYNQRELARLRLKPFRLQDAYNVTQDAIRLVPKS